MAILEILLLVSSATKAYGAFTAANQAEREGRRLAADALERGERDAELYGMDLAQLLGTQRTNFAASGLDTTFGSAAAIAEQTERFGMEDIETIRENAMREANALRRGGTYQAQQLRMQGAGELFGAAGTVLSMGANAWDIRQRTRGAARLAVGQTRETMGRRSSEYSQDLQRQLYGGR